MRWLNRDYSSLVYGQWSTEHAGSAKDTVALYSLPSSVSVQCCNTGCGGNVVYPPSCPRSLPSPPLLNLLSSPLPAEVPLLWWQRSTGDMQLQLTLCSLAWVPQGLGFP